MLLLKTAVNELMVRSVEILKEEHSLHKVTQRIDNFLELGWNEFVEELENQKIKLSLQQKDELNKWFREKQKNYVTLLNKMKKILNSIDEDVFKLYQLSDTEIKIIVSESSQKIENKNIPQTSI